MKLKTFLLPGLAALLVSVWSGTANCGETIEAGPLLEKIRAVGPKAAGHRAASAAGRELSKATVSQLSEILAGMDGANPLATNWLRAIVETIAQRELKQGGQLPLADLEKFLQNRSHSPRARRLAYELIVGVDPLAEERFIPDMLDDPSLELRRDAVARLLGEAEKLNAAEDKQNAAAAFRRALTAARDLDQIKGAAGSLGELGETVDLPAHFGFVMRWNLIGPFDNTNKGGFNVAYPPEKEIDLSAAYAGKEGTVKWKSYVTADEYGIVDLNEAISKHMGAVAYAHAVFISDRGQDVELRLGCINANKVWLNGKLLTANEVYHANTQIDQYAGRGTLKKGRNTILLKICQNEQTENWAQRWQFQLRVCDRLGTAVLSQDRPLAKTAALDRKRR